MQAMLNSLDLAPQKVRDEMTFEFVDTIDEVLDRALEPASDTAERGGAERRPRAASV